MSSIENGSPTFGRFGYRLADMIELGAGMSEKSVVHEYLAVSVRLALPASRGYEATVRRLLRDVLGAVLGADDLDKSLLALSELLANAIRHSEGGLVTMRLAYRPGFLAVTVMNVGEPFSIDDIPSPTTDQIGGRGLHIVRSIGRTRARCRAGRTTVRVEVPVLGR